MAGQAIAQGTSGDGTARPAMTPFAQGTLYVLLQHARLPSNPTDAHRAPDALPEAHTQQDY
eukprot:3130432-Prymnesium_polylepis.1